MTSRIYHFALIAVTLMASCSGGGEPLGRNSSPESPARTTPTTREGRVRDANDTDGPLDIAWIQHARRKDVKGRLRLVHTVRLFEPWPVHRLRHQGFVHLLFQLRGHRGNPEERTLWIIYAKGKLRAEMYNTLGDPPKFLSRVKLWRRDARTVKVAFPKALLGRRTLRHYRWGALSFIEARHRLCPKRDGCGDFAPDLARGKRYLRHDL